MEDVNAVMNQALAVIQLAFDNTIQVEPGEASGPDLDRSVRCAIDIQNDKSANAPNLQVTAEDGLVTAHEVGDDFFQAEVPVKICGCSQLADIVHSHRSTSMWDVNDQCLHGQVTIEFNIAELGTCSLLPSPFEGFDNFKVDAVTVSQLHGKTNEISDELLFRWGGFLLSMYRRSGTPDQTRAVRRSARLIFEQSSGWSADPQSYSRFDKLLSVCSLSKSLHHLENKFPYAFTDE